MAATALLLGRDVSITVFNLYLTQLQLKFGTQVLLTNTHQGFIPPQTTNVGTHPVACQCNDGGVAWSLVSVSQPRSQVPMVWNTNIEVQAWKAWYFCHVKSTKGGRTLIVHGHTRDSELEEEQRQWATYVQTLPFCFGPILITSCCDTYSRFRRAWERG